VILTMKTLSVLAYFGSIILSIVAGVIENNP
jgi:hypothetical protein